MLFTTTPVGVRSPLTLCCGHLLSTGDIICDLDKCEPSTYGQVRNSHDPISSLCE